MSSWSSIFPNLDSTNSSSSTTSSTIPSVGLTVAMKAFKILSSSLSESSSGLVSLKVVVRHNTLEICRTLMFHVTEALTPKALRFCGNSVLTTIPSIILPFVLTLELRRTKLSTILVKVLSIGIFHKLLELPSDLGLHLEIFINGRLFCLCHYFWLSKSCSYLYPTYLFLLTLSRKFARFQPTQSKESCQYLLIPLSP